MHHGLNFQLDGMMDSRLKNKKKEKDNEIFENSFAFVKQRESERWRGGLVGLIALPAIHGRYRGWKKESNRRDG